MAQRLFQCLLLTVLSATAFSQSQPPATQDAHPAKAADSQTPTHQESNAVYEPATVLRATTRLVVVDVVATNGKGDPVRDLKAEDFIVMEDGKEQKVRSFNLQQPPASGASEFKPQPVNLPPGVFSNIPHYNAQSALSVLLLDSLNTNLPNQAYAREEMIKYLAKIPDGRPVAVYTLDRNLHLIQDFTTDSSLLREVVKNLKQKASPLQDNPAGGTAVELAPPGVFDSLPAQMQQSMQEFENERIAFQNDLKVRYTLDAMNSLARALSGYGGRKNLIWISESFPISIDPDLTLSGDVFTNSRNYAPEIAQAAENLTNAQIAVYPIDARGLANYSVFSASSTGRDQFGRSLGNPQNMQHTLNNESAQLQNSHVSMDELAGRTGGKAFYNRNDLDGAIRNSIDDGSTYYTLGYYPENKDWNGKFRKIHVKVAQSGVKLRYRLGYYAVQTGLSNGDALKRQAAAFGQSLSLDFPSATSIRFHAGVVQPSEKTQNKVLVNFGIDPHAVGFEKKDDGLQHAMVDCAIQAYTNKGKLLKTEVTTEKMSLPPEAFNKVMQSAVPCQRMIELDPGDYLLRLGVMDEGTALIGTTTAKVTINPPAATAQKTEQAKPQ